MRLLRRFAPRNDKPGIFVAPRNDKPRIFVAPRNDNLLQEIAALPLVARNDTQETFLGPH
jgi:hypothetical protein